MDVLIDVARRFEQGEVSLREAAALLGLSAREAIEVLSQEGARGGFHIDTDLRVLETARELARKPGLDPGAV